MVQFSGMKTIVVMKNRDLNRKRNFYYKSNREIFTEFFKK